MNRPEPAQSSTLPSSTEQSIQHLKSKIMSVISRFWLPDKDATDLSPIINALTSAYGLTEEDTEIHYTMTILDDETILLGSYWSAEKLGEINAALASYNAPNIFLEETILAKELYHNEYTPSMIATIITTLRERATMKQTQLRIQRHVTNIVIPRTPLPPKWISTPTSLLTPGGHSFGIPEGE